MLTKEDEMFKFTKKQAVLAALLGATSLVAPIQSANAAPKLGAYAPLVTALVQTGTNLLSSENNVQNMTQIATVTAKEIEAGEFSCVGCNSVKNSTVSNRVIQETTVEATGRIEAGIGATIGGNSLRDFEGATVEQRATVKVYGNINAKAFADIGSNAS